MYYVGIDTGTHTGFAVWNNRTRQFESIEEYKLYKALEKCHELRKRAEAEGTRVCIRVEDARQRTWFGKPMPREEERKKLQGVGMVKRDCNIWEEFLTDYKFEFQMVAPKNNATKLSADQFKAITGWKERTNEHKRDAAMLVFGF